MTSIILNEDQLYAFLKNRCLSNLDERYLEEKACLNKLLYKGLPYIFDLSHFVDLCNFSKKCNVSEKQLRFFIRFKKSAYSSFDIPKRSGKLRRIDAPAKPLKCVQRWILDNILNKLNPGRFAHGFVPKRSIVTNARKHVRKDCVMCMDLKDFFPSIGLKRIQKYFKSLGYNDDISKDLAELCTYRFRLSQGSPASPMLSNLIAYRMDLTIANFCKKRRLNYTRYADDITISGRNILPRYKTLIRMKIAHCGFKVNEEKTRVLSQGSCQKVAGIVVNKKPSVGRKYKRQVRAILHNILKNGPIVENRENHPFFKQQILGKISHIINVEPKLGNKLKERFYSINWDDYDKKIIPNEQTEMVIRSVKRNPFCNGYLPFEKIEAFKFIPKLPMQTVLEITEKFSNLKENCKNGVSHKDCSRCLLSRDKDEYKRCIKYILGHFLGKTGGPHHGHEVCDIGIRQKISDHEGCFVCYIIKPHLSAEKDKSGNERNSFFSQFYKKSHYSGIDVITTVTMTEIDNELDTMIKSVMNETKPEKYYCFITDREFSRIFWAFENISNASE